jgi:hypothetical protein
LKTAVICGLVLAAVASSRADDPFADSVISYVPGTGQNTTYENSSAALGAPASGATITSPAFSNSQIVGIGNGGELTVEFDTPILNDPSYQMDGMAFTVFGNDFFVQGSQGISSTFDHPGLTVWVSEDNVTYYELDAPYGADDSFPTEGSGNPALPVSSSLSLSSFVGVSSAQALDLYDGSAGGASFSLSWAENSGGDPVDLPSISYIKVEGSGGYGYVDAFARTEAIPEPGDCLTVAFGVLGAVLARRWRGRTKS